ncbi:hypothetical protein ON010_g3831 [Phytophthora cinnamomi]|nr:hypothetical protein ON010_g3831 [Phytophthora cinnamomi]
MLDNAWNDGGYWDLDRGNSTTKFWLWPRDTVNPAKALAVHMIPFVILCGTSSILRLVLLETIMVASITDDTKIYQTIIVRPRATARRPTGRRGGSAAARRVRGQQRDEAVVRVGAGAKDAPGHVRLLGRVVQQPQRRHGLVEHARAVEAALVARRLREELGHAEAQRAHGGVVRLHGGPERGEGGGVREHVGPVQRQLHVGAVGRHVAADVVALLGVAARLHGRLLVRERVAAHGLVGQHLALLRQRLAEERPHLRGIKTGRPTAVRAK